MQTVFQKPITNSEAMIIFAQGWPDIIKTLQEKCENSVNEKTGYRCEEKWSDICENAHSKICRELNNCISKCAMLNENTVCYLLTHHLEAEDISARVRDIIARKQVRFFYDDNKTIDVKHYTMMCVVDEIWETMLNAIKWDMECLEASFKNLVKEHQPIAIYGEKRHNM